MSLLHTVAVLCALLGSVIVILLLVDAWPDLWAWVRTRRLRKPIQKSLVDEARRDTALRPFHLPAAKGLQRDRLNNLVKFGDRRAQ